MAMRSISAALNNTLDPILIGWSFPVRCNQKSVVSPIFKIARASARVNRRGTVGSFAALVEAAAMVFSLPETRRTLAQFKEPSRALPWFESYADQDRITKM
jgi:hypothetical protein